MPFEILSTWLGKAVLVLAWIYAAVGALLLAMGPQYPTPVRVVMPILVVAASVAALWRRPKQTR